MRNSDILFLEVFKAALETIRQMGEEENVFAREAEIHRAMTERADIPFVESEVESPAAAAMNRMMRDRLNERDEEDNSE